MTKNRRTLALPAWALTGSSLLIVALSTTASGQPQHRSSAEPAAPPQLVYDLDGLLAVEDLAMGDGVGIGDPLPMLRRISAARPFVTDGGPSQRSLDCLTSAIYYEASSEGEAGQRAVAQVVLNRVRHPAFPNSVCGVVYQGSWRRTGCQFTFTCDGSLRRRPAAWAWAEARRIAADALAGQVYAPVGHATHYHTNQVHPYWAPTLTRVTSIGAHIFYRWRGAAGEPQSFTQFAAAETSPPARVRSAELASRPTGAERSVPRPEARPVVRIHVAEQPTRHVSLASAQEKSASDLSAGAEQAIFAPTSVSRTIGPVS